MLMAYSDGSRRNSRRNSNTWATFTDLKLLRSQLLRRKSSGRWSGTRGADRKSSGRWSGAAGAAPTERAAADRAGRQGRRLKKEQRPMGRGERGGADSKSSSRWGGMMLPMGRGLIKAIRSARYLTFNEGNIAGGMPLKCQERGDCCLAPSQTAALPSSNTASDATHGGGGCRVRRARKKPK